jgi:1-acyl-sn-glycerol-3-phosphate acyltransferase
VRYGSVMLLHPSEEPRRRPTSPGFRLRSLRRGARAHQAAESGAGAVDVVWALRHLGALRQVDWTRAERDPHLIGILDRAFAGFYERYFRMEIRGWENVPGGRALLVGNHSGFGVAELLMLLVAWFRRFGPDRAVYALAHRWLYKTPFLRVVVPKIGGVPASWHDASEVLVRGDALAVFPGGELESTRPFSERYKVNLHGRRGFVRLALAHDVPVVPFVTIGSHATIPMPPGMHTLATVTGARRYLGLEAVPLPIQLLAWVAGALALDVHVISSSTYLLLLLATPPLYPSKMTTVFGPLIPAAEIRRLAAGGVDAAYDHVERLMQATMDELAAERRSLFS